MRAGSLAAEDADDRQHGRDDRPKAKNADEGKDEKLGGIRPDGLATVKFGAKLPEQWRSMRLEVLAGGDVTFSSQIHTDYTASFLPETLPRWCLLTREMIASC